MLPRPPDVDGPLSGWTTAEASAALGVSTSAQSVEKTQQGSARPDPRAGDVVAESMYRAGGLLPLPP
jgi:hypothetical protein